ncbi:MAG TPA: hypothetical protein VLE47_03775 [Candidatus Saccharimonadales bacterium]|nr:hypothetical protein [Candidatus Saccharimonadales bacterium]
MSKQQKESFEVALGASIVIGATLVPLAFGWKKIGYTPGLVLGLTGFTLACLLIAKSLD